MTVKVRRFRSKAKTAPMGAQYEVDIRFPWPDGDEYRERIRAPGSSISGARRWGEQRERDLVAAGKPRPPTKIVPTLAEFEEQFIRDYAVADRQKASTIESKRQIFRTWLVPVLGGKRLDEINHSDVQKLKGLLSERKAKTVNNVLTVLNVTLKTAHAWGITPAPTIKIKWLDVDDQRKPVFYTFAEYEEMIAGARKAGPENLLVVLLGGDAGLRLGEIAGLEWPCVKFDRNVLVVDKKDWHGVVESPKSGRTREVPMTARLAAALKAFKHLRGLRVLYGDSEEGKKTVTERMMRNWIMSAEKRAGMYESGRVHILRHTFCSHLAMRGATVMAIKELAGHADLATTMRYMHLTPSHREQAIALLDSGRANDTKSTTRIHGDGLETAC